jgi:PAS domain S-box-containing protein
MAYDQQFAEMKRFVRFGAEDEVLLRELCAHAKPRFDAIAREFYERNREHEEAHAVFQDEAQIARLHVSLVAWLARVLSGPYDAAYCEKSVAIGRVHVRVGLPQRFMFTGMALFRLRLGEIALETMGERAASAQRALARILDIELGLMNATYLEAAVARAQRLEDERRADVHANLEKAGRHYAAAVELAGAILVGFDADGRIELFNREASRVTGFAADEVLGESFRDRIVADTAPFDAAWHALGGAAPGTTTDVSFAIKNRAGRLREIEAELSRGPENGGGVIHILAGRDVTEDRALASRLRQSERLAAVGTLAAGLAHEIRNPLNGAQLHLTYLRRALVKAKLQGDLDETIDVVSGEIKRLSSLVSEFLSFARPGELARKRTSIRDLCQRSIALVGARPTEVEVTTQLPDADVVAFVDPAKMEQVLLNLLSNAIDAAAQGGGSRVVLRAFREPRFVIIEVEDDGPGLGSADAPIFDAFYSTKPGGTGLGLAIVHRIVSDHEGVIDTRRQGDRTVFRLRLPLDSDGPESRPDSRRRAS